MSSNEGQNQNDQERIREIEARLENGEEQLSDWEDTKRRLLQQRQNREEDDQKN